MIDFALAAASPGGEGFWLWRLLGRLHPMAVHFPIALLVAAALLDGWRLIRKRRAPSTIVVYCLILAALGAMGSAALGWASAAEEKPDAETARLLSLHRWMGLGVAVAAPLLALVSIRARRTSSRAIVHGYRAALWACVALVSTAAHYGGMLVYGEGYISSAWAPPAPGPVAPRSPLPPATAASVVFERDIAPIFRAHCIKCHGPEKQKGKYRLDSRELALKGGESGKVIVPGSAKDSPLYLLLLEKEAEDRMPPKDNPLTAEKIELIRAWIDQGADWPDLKQSSAPKTGGP